VDVLTTRLDTAADEYRTNRQAMLDRLGDWVEAGQTVLVLEAIKMEHRIVAPVARHVRELRAAVDEAVAADAVLAVVEETAEVVA
jgi:biotin carboxyl carrier protein